MANKSIHLPIARFGESLRNDSWWAGPAATVLVLTGFIVYATWRAFEGSSYEYDAYLSPFYSPFFDVSWARAYGLSFFTPAMLILPGPASFRFTCYYYRKAYYRAFAWDPPACAVGERAPHRYHGETRLLLFQNLHRYAMYVAVVFLVVLWKDAIQAVVGWRDGVHVGVGTLIMLANVVLLSGYTFGCHSFRHLIGGSVNGYSTTALGGMRHALWKLVTVLNVRHMQFAWMSLFSVALTDLYIRSVATGCLTDLRLF
ncbi:MAG TPA: hypothetical protein VGY54_06685 [Polyangiaceae bacterium]|jgi:hypothetical protein|nr:hypothetical protein [Polyangiaceae bacterium]